MTDLKDRFRALTEARPPDLWPDIERREPRPLREPSSARRFLVAAVALALTAGAVTFAVYAFRRSPEPPTPGDRQPTPATGVANGKIAFVVGSGGATEIYLVNPDGTDETLLVEGRDPAWSPDGTQIAYRTGNPNRPGGLEAAVHIVNADGTNPRRFEFEGLGEASGEAGPPVWSPDGSLIAFDTLDGIYVMRPDRTGLRRVSQYEGEHACHDLEPSWSPDGTKLVFAVLCEGGSEGIWTVNADGSGRTQLMAGDYETTDYRYPTWSPDGTKIAFVGLTGGPSEFAWHIHVMNSDGTDVVRLTDGPGSRGTPTWSPDGRRIAFSNFSDGRIYIMNADGTGLAPIPGIREGCCPAWQPILPQQEPAPLVGARNGKIAYIVVEGGPAEGRSGISTVNPDGTGVMPLFEAENLSFTGAPAWSPDGGRIAVSWHADIVVVRANGAEFSTLTDGSSGGDSDPAWSPDAARIAFNRGGRIWVMDADGSDLVQLTEGATGNDASPTWSPDGKRIAFTRVLPTPEELEDTWPGIYVMDADGGEATKIADLLGFNRAAWSPDGSRIAFASRATTNQNSWEIFLVNPDGTDLTRLTYDGAIDSEPAWSPDGTKIAFSSNRAGNFDIHVMNPDGTGITRVTTDPRDELAPAWQPVPVERSTPIESPIPTATAAESLNPVVTATIPVGQAMAVAVGEGAVWMATLDENGRGSVLRVDPDSNEVVAKIPTGAVATWEFGGGGLLVQDGSVWSVGSIQNEPDDPGGRTDAALVRIDPATNRIVDTVRMDGHFAADVAIDAIGVWVLVFPDEGNMRVVRLDPDTLEPVATITLDSRYARQIFSAGGWIWVHEKGVRGSVVGSAILTRIDPATNEIVYSRPMDLSVHLFVPWDGWIWASANDSALHDALIRIDPSTGESVGEPVQLESLGLALAPGDDGLWVSGVEGDEERTATIGRFDAAIGSVDGSVPVEGLPIAIAPADDVVWVVTYEGSLIRIDLR